MTSQKSPLVVLDDAVFLDVVCGQVDSFSGRCVPVLPLQSALLAGDDVGGVRAAGGTSCLLTCMSDPSKRYLCTPPADVLLTFSPLLQFRITLAPTGQAPADPPPQSVKEAAERNLLPEWAIVERPLVMRNICNDWSVSVEDLEQRVVDTEWMRRHFLTGTGDEASWARPCHVYGLGRMADELLPRTAASDAAAISRLMLRAEACTCLSLSATNAVVLRAQGDDVAQECMAAVRRTVAERPWRLFMEGLTDSTGLMHAVEKSGCQGELTQAEWHQLACMYELISRTCAEYDDAAVVLPPNEMLDQLIELGMLRTRQTDGAMVPAAYIRRSWLVSELLRWFQTCRVPQGAASCIAPVEQLLCDRDVLVLETELPLAAQYAGMLPPPALQPMLESAAIVLRPLAMPMDIEDVRRRFVSNMRAAHCDEPTRLPLVVVEDVQLWSPQQLWLWLSVVFTAPQHGPAFARLPDGRFALTGSSAPFKLLLTYSAHCDDAGGRRLVLGTCAPHYVVRAGGFGFPGPMMSVRSTDLGRSGRQELLHWLASRAPSDAALLAQQIIDTHALTHTSELATSHCRRAELDPSIPIVESSDTKHTALYQLREQRVWPCQLMCHLPHDAAERALRPIDAVALTLPLLSDNKLAALACVVRRVVFLV